MGQACNNGRSVRRAASGAATAGLAPGCTD